MTISSERTIEPLPRTHQSLYFKFVEDDGRLTAVATEFLEQLRDFVSGMGRVIPCNATGTNVITLTPVSTAPRVSRYNSFDIFVASAAVTSTGSVTATVVPDVGSLSTLKVYKSDGATQAGAGDVVADSLYLFVYSDHLDGGAGGFVRK